MPMVAVIHYLVESGETMVAAIHYLVESGETMVADER